MGMGEAMRTLVYCYRSGQLNNWLGLVKACVFPSVLTSPPLTAETFPYERLGERDLIYIALHGLPGRDVLWGDNQVVALDATRIAVGPRLRKGAVVILEGCYGLKTPFPEAFLERGAAAVIGSPVKTFDKLRGLGQAGRAGSALVKALRQGQPVAKAVAVQAFSILKRIVMGETVIYR